jgi:preprotein translocase subunit SecG
MQNKITDHRRAVVRASKIARLNRYVFIVALLWLVTSLALLLLSTPAHARTGHQTASQHLLRAGSHSQPPSSLIVI